MTNRNTKISCRSGALPAAGHLELKPMLPGLSGGWKHTVTEELRSFVVK